jgi:anti-sigma regulatory factor (Ser/Thr protein kinase)
VNIHHGSGTELLLQVPFVLTQLSQLRRLTMKVCRKAGLGSERAAKLVVAMNEAATNAIRHGGGRGRLAITRSRSDVLEISVSDEGAGLPDGLNDLRPGPAAVGGRGLWLMRECCDDVVLDSGPHGTTVRLHMALQSAAA